MLKKLNQKNVDNKELTRGEKIVRASIILFAVACIIIGVVVLFQLTGWNTIFDSHESVAEFIEGMGAWAVIIFIILQILQTTILPLPAAIFVIAGAFMFGNWLAILYSLIGIWIGSVISFAIGKIFGYRALDFMMGRKKADEWRKKLEGGKYVFFLMMLFPFFPDDILCIVAGSTTMSWKFFIITNLITRPLAVLSLVFFGTGTLIPFSGWGLYVWPFVILIIMILFGISYVFRSEIESLFMRTGKGKQRFFLEEKPTQIKEYKTMEEIEEKVNKEEYVEMIFKQPMEQDKEELAAFIREWKGEDKKFNIHGGLGLDRLSFESWLERANGKDTYKGAVYQSFLVRSKNKLVGLMCVSVNAVDDHLACSVRPSERNKGYGGQIIKEGIRLLNEKGVKRITLSCPRDCEPALKIIKGLGGKFIDENVNPEGYAMRMFEIKG